MARASADQRAVLAHPLSYVRSERGWTYQDVVDVVARRLNSACRREKAWRWENRGVEPDNPTQLALAAELRVPAETVVALGWPHWLPAGDAPTLGLPWTTQSGLVVLDQTAGAAVLDRRGFLVGGASVSVFAQQWEGSELPELDMGRGGGVVSRCLVSALEQRLPTLRDLEAALGGGGVRELVDAELRVVTNLLTGASYGNELARRLYGVAAELAMLAGWASFDAGRNAAAQRYWVAAVRAAHLSGDRGIGANVLKCMSLQLTEMRQPTEAIAVARAGLDGVGHQAGRVIAMLAVRQARAHAAHGDASDCERLLARAEVAMSQAGEEVPGWAIYFDEAEYCAQVASCYLLLERHQQTSKWLTQALDLQPTARAVDRSTYTMWQADTYLQLDEVERACAFVAEAAPTVAAAQSLRNHNRLLALHQRIQKRAGTTAAARELDEQIHDQLGYRR